MANTDQMVSIETTEVSSRNMLTSPKNAVANIREAIDQPSFRRAFPTILAALTAVTAAIVFVSMREPNMTTLYASVSDADKSKIYESLKNMGMSVELDPATGEVLIPTNDYHQARISLAAQGLPEYSANGFEEIDNLPLGVSRSVETMKLKKLQENELSRSIAEISSVQAARVHLALPEKSVFIRNQTAPTASVFVTLKNGRQLDQTQVRAITNLVASSIPGMGQSGVSIIDQSGRLLSYSPDNPDEVMADSQLAYRMRLEGIYRSRIQSLVAPIVGASNVTAQVNLEIDFTRRETSQELVDPNDSAILSEQSSLNVTAKKDAVGIPGAISNQPPAEAQIDTANSRAKLGLSGAEENSEFETKSSTELKNYEVSRKFETVTTPSNTISRIDAAVLVRDRKVIDPDTGEVSYEPISDKIKNELEQLISSAIGIKSDRGDSLTITSQLFNDEIFGEQIQWYETAWFKSIIEKTLIVILLGFISLGVVRPMLSRILVPTSSTNSVMELYAEAETMADLATQRVESTKAVEVDEGETLEGIKAKLKPKKKSGISADLLDTANTYDDKVALVRMIVADEAGRVANVFKQLMRQDLDLLS
ncbi:flagellar basal-body MS-ring/collar protein FliF [Planktomarina temperata]|jgi:flagellar M-ring protein FliF|nr:flagellar basal-body MS-ring/collar protein FliF [bacterium]MDB2334614.1 flagellar basal-body MS-ring/collar protein FliF [Planktomarina temperata]MDB0006074.1 flagellar basal-body MS-ring/collar protein FliF [bacterium]MDB2615134.1 flagellar basal-body MS-ring/collar protein FliF [Planktomarina temperata]MDB4227794.1 flagellar basal-body MS-ring/collar protein FliF [bacterium]